MADVDFFSPFGGTVVGAARNENVGRELADFHRELRAQAYRARGLGNRSGWKDARQAFMAYPWPEGTVPCAHFGATPFGLENPVEPRPNRTMQGITQESRRLLHAPRLLDTPRKGSASCR